MIVSLICLRQMLETEHLLGQSWVVFFLALVMSCTSQSIEHPLESVGSCVVYTSEL